MQQRQRKNVQQLWPAAMMSDRVKVGLLAATAVAGIVLGMLRLLRAWLVWQRLELESEQVLETGE